LNLKGVILRSAILLGADLRRTDLSNADLGEANLGGDIWDGTARTEELRANLWDANLSGANLKDAKIAEEQLEGVKSLQGAILPDGTISSSSVAKDAEESGLLSDDAVNPPVTAEESRSAASDSDVGVQEAVEGRVYTTEVTFRRRNRALIETKKAQSDGHCEACGFCFEDHYGGLAKDCLVAHHINPIAHRTRPSMTSLDDIALLCPNCHAVVHTQDPPLSLEEVREMLKLDQIL
jgi:predicted HNH restriction endonuclease